MDGVCLPNVQNRSEWEEPPPYCSVPLRSDFVEPPLHRAIRRSFLEDQSLRFYRQFFTLAAKGFPKKLQDAARGAKVPEKMIRYVLLEGHEAHHILPHTEPAWSWWGGSLRKQMKALRKKAASAGFDLQGIGNGASLTKDTHNITKKADYYQKVIDRFSKAKTEADFQKIADQLAEELLKLDGKLK